MQRLLYPKYLKTLLPSKHQFALSSSIDEALSFLDFCHVRKRRELPERL